MSTQISQNYAHNATSSAPGVLLVQSETLDSAAGSHPVASLPAIDQARRLVTAKNKQAPERTRVTTLATKGAGWAQLGGCW